MYAVKMQKMLICCFHLGLRVLFVLAWVFFATVVKPQPKDKLPKLRLGRWGQRRQVQKSHRREKSYILKQTESIGTGLGRAAFHCFPVSYPR